jgi:hypothetical protein
VVVPFAAIKSFVDPSVQFGVQFDQMADTESTAESGAAPTTEAAAPAPRPPAEHKHGRTVPQVPTPMPANPSDDKPTGGGEVVRFDRFRKK